MSAELVLAVLGLVDGCIKLAKKTITLYQSYRGFDDIVDEKLSLMEAIWTKVELQLGLLRQISDKLNEEFAQSHLGLLQILQTKFSQAASRLEISISEDGTLKQKGSTFFKKLKFSFLKSGLDELISDLETWQSRFDPTWYLIVLMSNSMLNAACSKPTQSPMTNSVSVDANPLHNMLALRHALESEASIKQGSLSTKGLHLDPAGLREAQEASIPFSAARTILRAKSRKLLIAEPVDPPLNATISQVKADVEGLAKKLQQVDPQTFGLLQCYGLLKHRDPSNHGLRSIEFIFRAPPNCNHPISLRQLLLDKAPLSVSAIVRIAKQLVRSISFIHVCNFVHKNIRPDNILFFPGDDSRLGSTYLVGFTQFRSTHFHTNMTGDRAWHRNLYRHPQRQGAMVLERYIMQHDIYSLGVCLLELGLWQSFIWFPLHSSNSAPIPSQALGLSLRDIDFEINHSSVFGGTQEHLVALARRDLPPRIGDMYTEIVLACLTCLDSESSIFGSPGEMQDEDGIVVGVRFVEKILAKINDISI